VFTGPTIVTTLSISLVWILYNAIPPYLLLHYNFIGKGQTLRWACTIGFYLSGMCGLCAIILLWLVYPAQVRGRDKVYCKNYVDTYVRT
jgi:endoglucanase